MPFAPRGKRTDKNRKSHEFVGFTLIFCSIPYLLTEMDCRVAISGVIPYHDNIIKYQNKILVRKYCQVS